jgi:hypothetical protein
MATIRRTERGLSTAFCLILLAGSTNVASQTVSGVRFSVDTSAALFSMLGGRLEFAAGRGRIDVSTIAARAARSINDVAIGPPIARSGDYYLFDTTGYIVVRPSSRSFSVVSRTAATYRHGNVRESWDGYFEMSPTRGEDIARGDTLRLAQHGPFAVRWHLDRLAAAGPTEILARGRVLVADAPRGEAGVVRWMAVAPALATLRDSIKPLDSDLQLTTVIVLPSQSGSSGETHLINLHPISDIRLTEVELARLVLPSGYAETTLSGSTVAPSSDAAKFWQSFTPGDARRSAPPNDR